jgi:PAS domain S-box-containing protein
MMGGEPQEDFDDELKRLIDMLHETQQGIIKLGKGRVDAVVQTSGSLLLLPETQAHFRDEAALHRAFANERKAILDALPMHVALLGAEGDIRVVNQAWSAFATKLESWAGYQVGDHYFDHWRTEKRCGCADADMVMARIAEVLNRSERGFTFEYKSNALPGAPWLQLVVSSLAEGADRGAVVMHIDVSDRKQAEVQRLESKSRLKALIEEAPLAILVHSDRKPVIVNAAFAHLFGYGQREDVLNWQDLCSGLAQHVAPDVVQCIAGENGDSGNGNGFPNQFNCRASNLDGKPLDLDIHMFTMRWLDRQAVGVMISDITQQKANEEQIRQMQRLDALGQLTGGVAHDFNNLLTVILGNAEVLEESLPMDDPRRNWAALVRMASEKGAALTNRLLAFARRQALDPKNLDIRELLSGMVMLLHRTIGDHVSIRLLHDNMPCRVMADPSQLENAILNLCINARDAMPNGGTITISTTHVEISKDDAVLGGELEAGPYVMLAVSDTGHGMDEATVSRAFEPFFTTKQAGKGSGLGLSMVYGFIKQSRGAVSMTSQLGKGTEILLWLPRQPAAMGEIKMAADIGGTGHGQRILLVEDDDMVREYVYQQLSCLGYCVVATSTAADALEILEEDQNISLLFTDILMPGGMNGLQLAQTALSIYPHLRLLLTSGYADALAEATRTQFSDNLLPKPYKRDALAKKLEAVFHNSRNPFLC